VATAAAAARAEPAAKAGAQDGPHGAQVSEELEDAEVTEAQQVVEAAGAVARPSGWQP